MTEGSAELARRLLAAYVTASDSEAAVNASTYRRAVPLYQALRSALMSHRWSDDSVVGMLERLGRTPADTVVHRRLVPLITAELNKDDAARTLLVDRLTAVEKGTVVHYHLGADCEPFTADEETGLETPEAVRSLLAAGPAAAALRTARSAGTADPLVDVVIPVRARPSALGRARNAVAALASTGLQTLDRSRYRVVVVEQDVAPKLESCLADLADEYVFVENPNAFNKSWALNIGVAAVPQARYLCFQDADMLVEPDHLARVVDALQDGPPALLPYGDLLFLDQASSRRAIRSRLGAGGGTEPGRLRGFALQDVKGGYICVTRDLFDTVGGYDERFRGWADEDNEFYSQVVRHTTVPRWDRPLLHLWHKRPEMVDANGRRPNQDIVRTPRPADPGRIADPHKYAEEMARMRNGEVT